MHANAHENENANENGEMAKAMPIALVMAKCAERVDYLLVNTNEPKNGVNLVRSRQNRILRWMPHPCTCPAMPLGRRLRGETLRTGSGRENARNARW